jgi:hypothetical protein
MTGVQGGKLLATYVIWKKDDARFIANLGGPISFLEANLYHYKSSDMPGVTSVETILLQHAISFATAVAKVLADAATDRRRSPIFNTTSPARTPLFGTAPRVGIPRTYSSAAYTHALPVRIGTVAGTSKSRAAIRQSAMQLMSQTNAAVGQQQAAAEASEMNLLDAHRSDKAPHSRGRMFTANDLSHGLTLVNSKLRTAKLRGNFHSDKSVLVDDDDSEEDGEDVNLDGKGRGRRVVDTAGIGLPIGERDWAWKMTAGSQPKVGQRVAALYLNETGEPAWFDGIVLTVMERKYNRGTVPYYRLYFEDDQYDDWYTLPDATVAYRIGHKAAKKEISAGLAACM